MTATSQKSLLLRAWRERWPDTQWSIHAKRLLSHGDANQLTELLLQQALAGSSPNMLVLSYLHHAVSSHMVTFSSVIDFVLKYEDFGKLFCTRALLDLLENISKRASTVGNYEDSLQASTSLLSLLSWLLQLAKISIGKIAEEKVVEEYSSLLEKVANILEILKENNSTVGLLYVAQLEDQNKYEDIKKEHSKIKASLNKVINIISGDNINKLASGLDIVNNLAVLELPSSAIVDAKEQSLNASLNVLLNIEAILKSTNEISPFVEQILIVEATQGIARSTLYCELLRTSFSGMIDSPEELKWAAFTFLKIPHVLNRLVQQDPDANHKLEKLTTGLSMFLNFVPLLDLTDTRCGADCMHFLLNELMNKYSLLTDYECQTLRKRRQNESRKVSKNVEQQNSLPSASLILRAENTVSSVLKTLDADYSKNQDALLGVLCHMMSGKSFELILAAAAATGKLQSFAIKLIKFNEFSKQPTGETPKLAQTRSLLFDISFLMLCHFTQLYGTEMVCCHPESQNSFFLQWATRCLPEGGKYKSQSMFLPPDSAKVDSLLTQFNPGGELIISHTRWQDVCHTAPYAVQEVLHAWEHGVLNETQVKTIVDNVKSRMCCLPVVVTAYLCSVINTLDSCNRSKPLSILTLLHQPFQPDPTNRHYNERSNLMATIVAKIVQDVLPSDQRVAPDCEIPPNMPAYTMLTETFRSVFKNGCIDIKATQKMEYLLNLTGPKWFCQHVVHEVLSHNRPEDLSRAVGMAYSLFNLDLENLVLCLILHTLPSLLQVTGSRLNLLTGPKGRSLAQLTVISLVLLHQSTLTGTESTSVSSLLKRGRKRTLSEVSFDDGDFGEDERPNKMRKQITAASNDDEQDPFSFNADSFSFDDGNKALKEESQEKKDLKDPVNKALLNLFRMFSAIVSCGEVSQRTGFVISFIQEALKAGNSNVRHMLRYMPASMVSQLMKLMSDDFNTTLLLSLCDLSTTQGRKVATKVIAQNSKFQPNNELS